MLDFIDRKFPSPFNIYDGLSLVVLHAFSVTLLDDTDVICAASNITYLCSLAIYMKQQKPKHKQINARKKSNSKERALLQL